MRNADIDITKTNQWLKSARLKVEIEGLNIAAREKGIPTKNYQANITNENR